MDIKAIETVYNGYRFRSRLEARWAVFFDALGVKYEYEPEGYDLGEAGKYLPDFWLPEYSLWVEVKRSSGGCIGDKKLLKQEHLKAEKLRDLTGYPVVLCFGLPLHCWNYLYISEQENGSCKNTEHYSIFFFFFVFVINTNEVIRGKNTMKYCNARTGEQLKRFACAQELAHARLIDEGYVLHFTTKEQFEKAYNEVLDLAHIGSYLSWYSEDEVEDKLEDKVRFLLSAAYRAMQARFEYGECG